MTPAKFIGGLNNNALTRDAFQSKKRTAEVGSLKRLSQLLQAESSSDVTRGNDQV